MKKYRYLALVIFIFILGFLIRMVKLGDVPLGFTWDEAALGYNSYSLLQTGKDEHGIIAPIVFRSFGDYKPGLYVYLANPSILFLGLNEFSTRLPSAVFGSLLILLIYILVIQLFNNKIWALSSAFIAALNPWMIHFSRGAWESNVNMTLTLIGIILWFKNKYLYSALFFGLTLITYQSSKLFTPILLFLLFLITFKNISLKKLIAPGIVLMVFAIPILLGFQTQSGRLKVFSMFSYRRTPEEINNLLAAYNTKELNPQYYLFNSETLQYARTFLLHYFNYFSPKFLFMTGDFSSQRHTTPYYGYFHLFEFITIALGLFGLAKIQNKKSAIFIFTLLLISPIPAALSRDLVSGVRGIFLSLPLVVISGLGLSVLYKVKKIFFLMVIIFIGSFIYYLDLFYVHSKFYTSQEWLVPYKKSIETVINNEKDFSKVYITDKLGQPYIFLLFYGKINPSNYQNKSVIEVNKYGDVDMVKSFDKYIFGPIYWPEKRGDTNSLYVGGIYELPEQDLGIPELIRLGDIKLSNGEPYFRIVAQP